MRDLTTRQLAALRTKDYSIAYFFSLKTNLGDFNVWTGTGSIAYDYGDVFEAYHGMGDLIDIQVTPDSTVLERQRTRIEISYVPVEVQAMIKDVAIEQAVGNLYLGLINKDRRIIDNLIQMDTMKADNLVIESSNDGLVASISGQTGIINLNFPTRITWSPEHQREYRAYLFDKGLISADWTNNLDTGFDTIAGLVDKNPIWRVGTATPKFTTPVERDYYNSGVPVIDHIDYGGSE